MFTGTSQQETTSSELQELFISGLKVTFVIESSLLVPATLAHTQDSLNVSRKKCHFEYITGIKYDIALKIYKFEVRMVLQICNTQDLILIRIVKTEKQTAFNQL